MALEMTRPCEDATGVVPMRMRPLLFWLALAVGCLIICEEENQHDVRVYHSSLGVCEVFYAGSMMACR